MTSVFKFPVINKNGIFPLPHILISGQKKGTQLLEKLYARWKMQTKYGSTRFRKDKWVHIN